MDIAIVVATVVVVVAVIVVLLRQGSPGRLSDEQSSASPERPTDRSAGRGPGRAHGRTGQWSGVAERPAGPDAESMSPDPPGDPAPAHRDEDDQQ